MIEKEFHAKREALAQEIVTLILTPFIKMVEENDLDAMKVFILESGFHLPGNGSDSDTRERFLWAVQDYVNTLSTDIRVLAKIDLFGSL